MPRAGEYFYRTERASAKDPVTIETMEADDFYRSTLNVQVLTGGRIRTEVDRRKEGGVRTTRELGIASTDSISETAVTISMDQGDIECVWEDPLKRIQYPLQEGASWATAAECDATWFGGGRDTRSVTETVVVGGEIGLVVEGTFHEGHVLKRRVTFESSAQGLKDTVKLTELYSTELDVVLQYRRIVERQHLGTVSYHREESHLIAFRN